MFRCQFIIVSRYSALKLGVLVRHVEKSKCALVYSQYSGYYPANCHSTIATILPLRTIRFVGEVGLILTGMTQRDRFAVDLCTTL